MDTTVKSSYCAHDRLNHAIHNIFHYGRVFSFRIVVGGDIRDCVVPDSVNVFKFDKEYSLNQTLVSTT